MNKYDEILNSAPENIWLALKRAIEIFVHIRNGMTRSPRSDHTYEDIVEAFSVCCALARTASATIVEIPEFTSSHQKNIELMSSEIEKIRLHCTENYTKDLVARKLRSTSDVLESRHFSITDGDMDKAQQLINEIRSIIASTDSLSPDHKARLLRRLERLQSELHKHVSDFDRVYGFAVEVSMLTRKVGEDLKPLIDRVRELVGIAWRTQTHDAQLPTGTTPPPLLPLDDEEV